MIHIIYIYIYILVCSCAYTCTSQGGRGRWGAGWFEASMLSTNVSKYYQKTYRKSFLNLPNQEPLNVLNKKVPNCENWNLELKHVLSECKHNKRWAKGRATAVAATARSVVYMMATTVACTSPRDFLCLARKYKKTFLGGLENRLGDVSETSKMAFGGVFGRGSPWRSILDQFWTRFWGGFWALNRA